MHAGAGACERTRGSSSRASTRSLLALAHLAPVALPQVNTGLRFRKVGDPDQRLCEEDGDLTHFSVPFDEWISVPDSDMNLRASLGSEGMDGGSGRGVEGSYPLVGGPQES